MRYDVIKYIIRKSKKEILDLLGPYDYEHRDYDNNILIEYYLGDDHFFRFDFTRLEITLKDDIAIEVDITYK